jgi:hypothetical protein
MTPLPIPDASAGDLFALPLPGGEYVTGRVMLDVKRQGIVPRRIREGSPLGFAGDSLLLEIYDNVARDPSPGRSALLVPGIWVYSLGRWPIVGHLEIDPTTVSFPQALLESGLVAHLVWGDLLLPIPGMSLDEYQSIAVRHSMMPPRGLPEIVLQLLGRGAEVREGVLSPTERTLADSDLRFSPHQRRVFELLNEPPEEPYYSFALRHGSDTRRFYE